MSEQVETASLCFHGDACEGFIAVTGGRIWYRMHGRGQPGLPLLVVHGGPGASHDYLEPLAALADARPVILYDQLGCGRADPCSEPGLWTVERYAAELEQIRQGLGLRQWHVLGQSWGTVLAVEHALSIGVPPPASLVLSGPMLQAARWECDQRRHIAALPSELQQVIRQAEAAGDYDAPAYQNAMLAYYRRYVCRLKEWPDCLERTFAKVNANLYRHMWGPSEFTVTGTLKQYDACGRLSAIACPVMLTCGEHDEASPATTRYFASRIAGAECRVFAGASHEHHLEKPAEYLAVVRDFLARAESAACLHAHRGSP